MSTPLSLASSKEAVSDWLQRNEFEEKTQRRLHGYNAAELFELSKRDCTSYVRNSDGICGSYCYGYLHSLLILFSPLCVYIDWGT